jgi:hypothetical protein
LLGIILRARNRRKEKCRDKNCGTNRVNPQPASHGFSRLPFGKLFAAVPVFSVVEKNLIAAPI